MSVALDRRRYRALVRRDPRLDGRVFVGVTTTGVFCRPVCPARTPHFDHVRFFASTAAAEAAGFRACLRCRPTLPAGFEERVVRLAYEPPLAWDRLLAFFAPRAIPGVEAVEPGVYRRTIRVGDVAGTLRVRPERRAPRLRAAFRVPRGTDVAPLAARVRRLFDLDASPAAVARGLAREPRLASAVGARPGLRVPGAWDAFELAVRTVLGQQVTVRGATTLAGRLVAAFGEATRADGLTHLFPPAGALVDADLASIGLPRARAATIRALAAAARAGALAFDARPSLDTVVTRLGAIPGVGPWTAHYVAMRGYGCTDAFPAGDLGLRKALANGAAPLPAGDLIRRAERWRPWRAYAAMHLWSLT